MVKFAIISEIEIYTDTSRSFVVSYLGEQSILLSD